MGKRENENAQISKEDYMASQSDGGDGAVSTGRFDKAPEEQLRKRRILKVGGRYAKTGGPSPAAIAAPRPPPSSVPPTGQGIGTGNSNPFASITNFSAAVATSAAAPVPNPFANVTLASSTAPSARPTVPPTQVGTPAQVGTAAQIGITRGNSSNKLQKKSRADRLNIEFFKTIRTNAERDPMVDWSSWVKEYLGFVKKIHIHAEDKSCTEATGGRASAPSGCSSAPTAVSGNQPVLGAAAPSAAVAGKAATPFTGFKFGGSNGSNLPGASSDFSGAKASKPFTGFSFSVGASASSAAPAPAAPAFSGTAHNPAVGVSPASDDAGGAPQEKPAEVQHEQNEDESTVYEVRAKYFKSVDKKWKEFSSGPLRLYRHKTNNSCRMVMRNDIGKVQLNLSVSKGMRFEKSTTKKSGFVKFIAIQDKDAGTEQFMLKVALANVDKLHDALTGMAK